ncbi:MAG: hypothetical protein OXH57_05380, partial [Ekhidna sp.]|nr:hypothetical protein [Ekhidna sp.]
MRLKITWMLLSAFGIPSSLLFQSCDKCKPDDPCEPILAINYQYSNQTVYSIATYRWDYDKEFVYELPARSQIEFEVDDGCINNVVPNFSTCPLIYADSIRIVFDNSRSYWLKH